MGHALFEGRRVDGEGVAEWGGSLEGGRDLEGLPIVVSPGFPRKRS
jgi:hypothetical protein